MRELADRVVGRAHRLVRVRVRLRLKAEVRVRVRVRVEVRIRVRVRVRARVRARVTDSLHALAPRDADAHVGLLDHRDVVGAVADCEGERRGEHVGLEQTHDVRLVRGLGIGGKG